MTDITSIPLNKLTAWDGNVRKTAGADTALAELASSLAAHGLLQSLVVRKAKKGKFAVVAGCRRLAALQRLVDDGTIADDYAVPCQLIAGEADATEISLAENSVREQMHPADEFEAFRDLADKGMAAADIAARFGVTEAVVSRRLTLARVSPVIIAAYRRDELSLAQVMAFAVSDDHKAQEHVLENLPPDDGDPSTIRDALTEQEVAATDRRVSFVTLSAYEQAGGASRRDLFSEDESGIFILDTALLDRLAMEKLEAAATDVRAEGWKWIAIRTTYDYGEWSGHQRWREESIPMSAEADAEHQALSGEYEKLQESEDELDEQTAARLAAIEERLDALEDTGSIWPAETLAIAGALVSIDDDGEIMVRRGLVSPEDAAMARAAARKLVSEEDGDDAPGEEEPPLTSLSLPHTLVQSLTTQRTAALAAALFQQPRVALAATVHSLAVPVFCGQSGDSCLRLSATTTSLKQAEGSQACALLDAAAESWGDKVPGDPKALFAWCLEQDVAVLIELLAFLAARTVNAVQAKGDRPDSGRLEHATALADALAFDMTAWFAPTAANYFAKVSKAAILDAIREAKGATAPAWEKAKKAELATLAERETAGTGWLPEILRKAA